MKIVILHQHWRTPQSGGAIRSFYLAKALVENGHHVSVITGNADDGYRFENVENINVHHLPVTYDNRFGFSRRIFAFVKYITGIIRRPSIYKDNDLVYAISVPLTIGLAALWIKRWYHIPFIFEVGDLWPDAPIEMGFIKSSFLKNNLFRLEKKIYKEARSIVALSPAIKEAVEKRVYNKTVHLIPNMADTCFYKPSVKSQYLLNKFQIKAKFFLSYIGAIGMANGLEFFLKCAKESQQVNLPVEFLICGEGAELSRLRSEAGQMKLQNITFIPFKNREGVKEVMDISDSIFVCYKRLPVLETGSPNKYFDGLAAGKLIMINFEGWIKEEIENNRCGIYIDPNYPSGFIRLVTPFLQDIELLQRYQHAARGLAEKYYSRKTLTQKFLSVITSA